MHTFFNPARSCARFAYTLLAISLVVANADHAAADFAAVGDVISSLGSGTVAVDEAGGTADNLIIGDTGTGGLLGDGVAPLIGTLSPLESNSAIIGNQAGSIGAVNIEDFIPGGNWTIAGDLVVGNAGLGFLDFLNAAGVGDSPATTVGGTTYVGGGNRSTGLSTASGLAGDPRLGEGVVRINGLGSRLITQDLIVGGAGIGVLEASGRSVLNTIGIVELGSSTNADGESGDGTIILTDLGTRWTAGEAVTVGGLAGTSHGKIMISNQAVFQIDGATSSGALTINPRGRVELAGGTLRMLDLTTDAIANNGVIYGDGFIDGSMDISATGELRNAAAVADQREYLLVSNEVTNAGLIESNGGEMEFEGLVTNTGDIVARDAIMRFRGTDAGGTTDLDNSGGRLTLGGDTTIYANIVGPGAITTTDGSAVVVLGDISFTTSPLLAAATDGGVAAIMAPEVGFGLTVGDETALTIEGDLDLGGVASLSLDYVGEEPIAMGDMLSVLSVTGGISGSFANSELIAEGRRWDIDIVGDDVLVTAGALVSSTDGDFDFDGHAAGSDFLTWQRGPADPSDLAAWQEVYGTSTVAATAAVGSVVPEPSTLALAFLTLACCPLRRKRQA